jgi:hypothetical protein
MTEKKKPISLAKEREKRGEEAPADLCGDGVGVTFSPLDLDDETEVSDYVRQVAKRIEFLMDSEDVIPLKEAAEMMNCSMAYAIREIEKGRVKGCGLRFEYVASRRSVMEWCKENADK